MKISRKILCAGLLSTLLFSNPNAFAATADEIASIPPAPRRNVYKIPDQPEAQTGCRGCLLTTGRLLKKAKGVLETDVLPMLRMATLFIQDEDTRKTLEDVISVAEKGSKIANKALRFNEDGSVEFIGGKMNGKTLANAVLLVVNDNLGVFTDESEMLLSLVLDALPEGDFKTKMLFTTFLAAGDNPRTDNIISFDPETGNVGLLISPKAITPTQTIKLFGDIEDTKRRSLGQHFAEYIAACEARTAAEAETRERDPHLFLKKEADGGTILRDYTTLITEHPAFEVAKIAKNVLRGETLMDAVSEA
jgi:hypothetical protein